MEKLSLPGEVRGIPLGRYVLGPRLAIGGMGEVYLAVQLGLGRVTKPLALKLLLPHLSESPQAIQMFLDEAQLAARMNHRNVVQIFDVGVAEGRHYIAMELVRGVAMSAFIVALKNAGGRASGALLTYVGRALCDALHHAHELVDPDGNRLEVVHRDVTPHNVLLSHDGEVKLTDFGIAKARDSATHTRPGYVKGKFEYVAPEQLQGKPLDRRVDIFGAGLTLYHLATLGSPFRRENELATLHAIERDPLPSLALLRPDLPRQVREAITRATHKDPNARFPTARAFRDALPPPTAEAREEAREELAHLVRTLCQDAIAKLESKTAHVKAMGPGAGPGTDVLGAGTAELAPGTAALEDDAQAAQPGRLTVPIQRGAPADLDHRVTAELARHGATAQRDPADPTAAPTARVTDKLSRDADATSVRGAAPSFAKARDDDDDLDSPPTLIPPRGENARPPGDGDETTGSFADGPERDEEAIPTKPPPPPLPAPARSLASDAPTTRPPLPAPARSLAAQAPPPRLPLGKGESPSGAQAGPRRLDAAPAPSSAQANRLARVDSAAGGSPAVPRAAKADAPPAPPRRADRSRTEDDLPAGGDPEASLSDPGENRRVSRAVMAGGMFGLMALGALLAWMFQLGAPVEPLPPPAPAPVARPAVTPPPPVRPQAPETRPASGSAAPLVRPASASVPGAELPPEGAPSAPTPAESPGNDRKAARVGFLTVEASPWANVYVGGKKLGQTPISRAPVEEGVVPVLLTNPQTGRSVSRKVRVMAGKTVNVKEDLR